LAVFVAASEMNHFLTCPTQFFHFEHNPVIEEYATRICANDSSLAPYLL